MLNVIYYPVSGILWAWHVVIGGVLGPMQEFAPQIRKLQEKYRNDRPKLAEEMQKLQREHGINPLGGCLPILLQVPVFIGLLQVLKGFQPSYPDNYVFDRADIASFLDADLFGTRLSESIAGGAQALGRITVLDPTLAPHVVPVALPLMVVAAAATHVNARIARRRQQATPDPAAPQAALLGALTLWVFPLGVLVGGAFFPVAMLLYWLTNNCWTLVQQYLVHRRLDRDEREQARGAVQRRRALAPRPGQKPER